MFLRISGLLPPIPIWFAIVFMGAKHWPLLIGIIICFAACAFFLRGALRWCFSLLALLFVGFLVASCLFLVGP